MSVTRKVVSTTDSRIVLKHALTVGEVTLAIGTKVEVVGLVESTNSTGPVVTDLVVVLPHVRKDDDWFPAGSTLEVPFADLVTAAVA